MLSVDRLLLEAAHKLRDAISRGQRFDTAQIQVIGLDDIKSAAGNSWRDIADRIRKKSMIFIESNLKPGDMVVPCGDGFVIVYAEVNAAQDLGLKCQMLQDRLNAFYLGEEGWALTTRVRGETVTADNIENMLTPPPRNVDERLGTVGVKFVPAWCSSRETVGLYLATPSICDAKGARLSYDPDYRSTGEHHRNDYLAVDLEILHASAKAAIHCQRAGRTCAIVYSVHATTMQDRRRREMFLNALASLPEALRVRLLGRIAEVAHGTPIVSLSDWVGMLHLFTPRVALELHHEERVLCCFNTVRAWSIGCVLPSNLQTADQRSAHAGLFDRWAKQAHRQNIKVGMFNVTDPALLRIACAFGVDYLGCEQLWPAANEPEDVRVFRGSALPTMRSAPNPPTKLRAVG